MKRIKIKNFTAPDLSSVRTAHKQYRVSLGNGYAVSFKSEKETLAFLAQTNRDLNTRLYELNFLFAEVLKIYRNAWPYFDSGKKSGLIDLQGSIQSKVAVIESSFNILVDRSDWENGNHFTFSHFYSIISAIKEICEDLVQLYLKKNHPIVMYECESLSTRLDHIYTSIVIYPQKIELVKENRQVKAVLKVVN